jgi:hypothetical protein
LSADRAEELSAEAIRKRRAEICDKAMTKLTNFETFDIAEKALIDDIDLREGLSVRSPQQVQMQEKLKQALRDLREGVEATRRMLKERCKVRERAFI